MFFLFFQFEISFFLFLCLYSLFCSFCFTTFYATNMWFNFEIQLLIEQMNDDNKLIVFLDLNMNSVYVC